MLFSILLFSFFAGVLTVLAPCVLPLLPVILSGSLAGQNKWRPYIIIGSLIFSLLVFTLLLKVSTVFIHVDPAFWEYVSGGILVLFSLTLIFPKLWPWLMDITGIEKWSQKSLENANKKGGIWGAVFLGAALGPIFSSCNPTYTLLLATILPADRVTGMLGLLSYFVGLGLILLLVAHFGRSIISRFRFFSNPNGLFRKLLGVIIFLVGAFIVTGVMKDIETYIVERGFFINAYSLEEKINQGLLPPEPMMCSGGVCKPKNARNDSAMMNIGNAPELAGIADWINTQPLTLASLRGKVVLVDFWTYSCINCKRTQPYLNTWYDMYEKDGLVIIGVHAPEFTFEKITSNVREASKKAGIRYPVALDNDFTTWNAYANQYWPAKYLIDQEGRIRYKHFGEGKYDETEKAIQELLGLSKSDERVQKIAKSYDPSTFLQSNMLPEKQHTLTPETYLGTMRGKNMVFETGLFQDGPQAFSAGELLVNNWTLSGPWKVTPEYLESFGENSALILRFAAKKVFLVVSSDMKKGEIIVNTLNNKKEIISTKTITVAEDELYTIFESEDYQNDTTITLQPSDGLRLHAFTFGE